MCGAYPAATTHHGIGTAFLYILIGHKEIALVLEKIIFFAGIDNIEQVRRHCNATARILCNILSRTNVHSAVDLTAVSAYNLAPGNGQCQFHGQGGLATCRRTHN
jgi:hypothetical protein